MSDSSSSLPLSLERDRKAAKKLLKQLRSANASQARAAADRFIASHPAFRHLEPEAVVGAKPTLRDAQLTIAREYGFSDWNAWKTQVAISNGDKKALLQAGKRLIKAQDGAALQRLLSDAGKRADIDTQSLATELFSSTLSWVNFAAENEAYETHSPCDRVLLDAGAEVGDHYVRSMVTASTQQLRLIESRGKLPRNLRTAAALGDLEAVRGFFDEHGRLRPEGRRAPELAERRYEGLGWPDRNDTPRVIADALRFAARHAHREVVSFLLDRALDAEPELDNRIASLDGPSAIVDLLCQHRRSLNLCDCLLTWELVHELRLELATGNMAEFEALLEQAPEFLGAAHLSYQLRMLEVAAYTGHDSTDHTGRLGAPIAKVLLEKSAALRAAPERLASAMRRAIEYGNRQMVDLLRPFCQPDDDLPTAAALGNLGRVRSFLDDDGRFGRFAAPSPEEGADAYSPLMHALGLSCMNGELEVAEFLLEHGADVNGTWSTHQPATVLHEMAGTGRMREVRFLIEHGADPTIRDEGYGAFAHGWAGVFGHPEIHHFLLECAAERNLFAAVDLGNIANVERLVAEGHDVNEQVGFGVSKGQTPLFLAVSQDRAEMVILLLSLGADAKARDGENRGALHRIHPDLENGIRIAQALLAAGADPQAADNSGQDAIAWARSSGQVELAKLLAER